MIRDLPCESFRPGIGREPEAGYEITGLSGLTTSNEDGRREDQATTRQHTTITVMNIESGQTVFTHSVDTRVHSRANRSGRTIVVPARLLHIGKQTAARACAAALQKAMNDTP
jgi:hypothetical protein